MDGTFPFLDVRTAKRKQERRKEVPTSAEFRDALEALRPSMPQQLMDILCAHRRLPGDTATMLQLAKMCSAWTPAVMEVEYARLGRKISRLLGFLPEARDVAPPLMPIVVIATPEGMVRRGAWRLRPEIAAALDALKGQVPTNRPNGAGAAIGSRLA